MKWFTAMMAALALLRVASLTAQEAVNYVWWEGEDTRNTNFPARSWFSADTIPDTRHLLSGGDWLSNSGNRAGPEAYATYAVTVPRDGEYRFWTRKFWKHGPFRWRFDQGEWQVCPFDVALADDTFLREHVGANWVYLGRVPLTAGEHTFELRLLAKEGEPLTACFDCFLLTPGPFLPNGRFKPGERSGRADDGFFAWEPGIDPFGEALLDLRSLNEATAGEHGFVRREDGHFVLGDGRPVRFWAVNVGPNNVAQDRDSIDYLARKLAKLGVNMVRFHGPLFDRNAPDPALIDAQALDHLHYLVAALKREGIYTTISFYFPLWFDIRPNYGIGGFESLQNKRPFALLYFERRMQEIHRAWLDAILTTENPYTGLPPARDPAVAIVEIVNEDSFFFWTFSKQNIPTEHWRALETQFGRWLTERYGSLGAAYAAWGGGRLAGDVEGRAELLEAWHMTTDGLRQGGPDKTRRVGDQVRFLAELQRGCYESVARHVRDDLGAGCLISASNWQTADAQLLDAIERYTYTAGDVLDRHGYFGGRHEGDGAGWSVRVGHTFESVAAVTVPERLPLQFARFAGYPQTISELNFPNPNRYRGDLTFLAAAYGALQGLDGVYFFAVGSNFLADTSLAKFAVSCPIVAGAFPAAALAYRRGDITTAEPVIDQVLTLDDLFAMRGSGVAAAAALDELRRADIPTGGVREGEVTSYDPLSFYVGVVQCRIGDDPTASRQVDVSRLIDRERRRLVSLTGELRWDWGQGVVTVDTPRAAGACGFLGRHGPIELGAVTIDGRNEFGTVWVIALDERPLAESQRLLIQATTEEQPLGFRTDGDRITALGGAPFGLRRIDATVTWNLRGPGAVAAVALDENGYRTDKPVDLTGGAPLGEGGRQPVVVRLAPDAVYHVLSR